MLRALFFDYYGVWTPDHFSEYLLKAEQQDESSHAALQEAVSRYFLGLADIEYVADKFKFTLNDTGISASTFVSTNPTITPSAIKFIQYLHSHFVKVGILANLGKNERDLLTKSNTQHKLFENISDSFSLGSSVLKKDVFVKAFQDIGEPRDSCLIVSSNNDYLNFADSLGIKTHFYTTLSSLTEEVDGLL